MISKVIFFFGGGSGRGLGAYSRLGIILLTFLPVGWVINWGGCLFKVGCLIE